MILFSDNSYYSTNIDRIRIINMEEISVLKQLLEDLSEEQEKEHL
jgi:hypothetical protein